MYVGICLEMLQFQSRHYVIALSADWLTQILKHAPTPYWCKITITRSLEGARYDAFPECPKCTRNASCVPISVNGEIWTPSIPCDILPCLTQSCPHDFKRIKGLFQLFLMVPIGGGLEIGFSSQIFAGSSSSGKRSFFHRKPLLL